MRWKSGSRIVEFQGGSPRVAADPNQLDRAPSVHVVEATSDGYVTWRDVQELGRAIVELGGGRRKVTDEIDPTVGIVARVLPNERVSKGDPLFDVHHAGPGLAAALTRLDAAFVLAPEAQELPPLVSHTVPHTDW